MKKRVLSLLLLSCLLSQAQKTGVRYGFLAGANKMLWGLPINATKIGFSGVGEFSFSYRNLKSAISFEPMILFGASNYYSKADERFSIKISQGLITFMPMAGLTTKKALVFKTGLFFQGVAASTVRIVYDRNSSFWSSIYDGGFHPAAFHAGLSAGCSIPIGEKKIFHLNFLFMQFVTPLLRSPYVLTSFPGPGKDTEVFNTNAKASLLMLGLNFKLAKRIKPNKQEDSN